MINKRPKEGHIQHSLPTRIITLSWHKKTFAVTSRDPLTLIHHHRQQGVHMLLFTNGLGISNCDNKRLTVSVDK